MLYLWILAFLLALETVLGHGHFAFPQNSPRQIQSGYEIEEPPQGKIHHKIKKIRKKQLLLCLIGGGGGGRNVAEDSPEAKFLFPVIQQTEVNVGHPSGGSNHLASSGYGGGSNCDSLLSSGGGGLLSHPLLSSLGGLGGLGGNKPSVDEDQNRYYHFNMKRHVMRPIYKSMKAFYRLFSVANSVLESSENTLTMYDFGTPANAIRHQRKNS